MLPLIDVLTPARAKEVLHHYLGPLLSSTKVISNTLGFMEDAIDLKNIPSLASSASAMLSASAVDYAT